MKPSLLVSLTFAAFAVAAPHASAAKTIRCQLADGFDFPVGKPDARGYYKARGYWPNGHLGEDWNGNGGGNTDLGDPVYSTGNGVVVLSRDVGMGWGNVVIIRHAFRDLDGQIRMVDSLYGHLHKRHVSNYQTVSRGQQIGTIGRGPRNMYLAHLHFEIRKNLRIGMNRTAFKRDNSNYYSPTQFIRDRRNLRTGLSSRYSVAVDTFAPYGKAHSPSEAIATKSSPASENRVVIPYIQNRKPTPAAPETSSEPVAKVIREIQPPPRKPGFWSNFRSKLEDGKATPGAPPD